MKPKQISLNPAILKPNPWNSNIVSPQNEAKLDESIRKLGMFKPVIVREVFDEAAGEVAYQIIGGEHRAQSAMRLGLEEIPVVNLGAIGDTLAKQIGLADNARYGADDTLMLAEVLKDIGDEHELASYLPFTDTELTSIFSAVDIALDELDTHDEDALATSESDKEERIAAPRTHTVMRFKVPIRDSERIAELISKTQKKFGYTLADEMTNAGDALVHLLLGPDESNLTDSEDPA